MKGKKTSTGVAAARPEGSSRTTMILRLRDRLNISASDLPDSATDAQINAVLERPAAPAPGRLTAAQVAERDRCIAAAIAEGRFGESRRATYEEAWARDPGGTRHLLTASAEDGGLWSTSTRPGVGAQSPAVSQRSYDRARAAMGLGPATRPSAAVSAAAQRVARARTELGLRAAEAAPTENTIPPSDMGHAQAAPRTSSAGLVTRDDGRMTFRGQPVAMGAGGEPCVFTTSGWMSVDAFERAGMPFEAIGAAAAVVRMAPSGPTAQAFRAGPTGSAPRARAPLGGP